MSDFSDRPFVAGSLTGLRAFGVDPHGRLYGPSFDQVFRPGENVAVCRKDEANSGWMFPPLASLAFPVFGPNEPVKPEATKLAEDAATSKPPKKPKHTLAGLGCSCGFYAYFDGRNDYKERHRLGVVIEGYGVCTVGTRGFRAEKARPVALIAPGRKFPSGRFQLVLRNYPEVPVYANKSAALEAHPLTVPEVPGPDSPGFWDRPVKS